MREEDCTFITRDTPYRAEQAEQLQNYLSVIRDMPGAVLGGLMVALWDILTALRSCDTENRGLKALTTARIRGFLGLRTEGVDTRPLALSATERERRTQLLNIAPEHFRNHYCYAVMAIWLAYGYNLLIEEDGQGQPHATYRELIDGVDTGNV